MTPARTELFSHPLITAVVVGVGRSCGGAKAQRSPSPPAGRKDAASGGGFGLGPLLSASAHVLNFNPYNEPVRAIYIRRRRKLRLVCFPLWFKIAMLISNDEVE